MISSSLVNFVLRKLFTYLFTPLILHLLKTKHHYFGGFSRAVPNSYCLFLERFSNFSIEKVAQELYRSHCHFFPAPELNRILLYSTRFLPP